MSQPNKIRATLQDAMGLHQRGNLGDAERLYKTVLAAEPRQFEALHYLGVLRLQQQRPQDAVDLISAAVRVNPASIEALSNLAVALAGLKRYAEALDALDRIVKQRPNDGEAHYNRAALLDACGRHDEAVAAYQKALALKPDNVAALFGAGNSLAASGLLEDALRYFDRALVIAPHDLNVLNNRAAALGKLDRNEEVLEACAQILAINPDLAPALNNYGNALRKLRRYDEALATFNKALSIATGYPDALTNRGTVLYQQRRYEEAAADYRLCLAGNPTAEAHRNYALALSSSHRQSTALEHFDKALALKHDYPEALRDRAIALQGLGRDDEALAGFEKSLERLPDDTDARIGRAELLSRRQRFAEAIAECEKVLAHAASDSLALSRATQLLALLYSNACDWAGIRANLSRLLACKPISPSILARVVDDGAILLDSATGWVQEYAAAAPAPLQRTAPARTDELRVGYLSQDFRAHVTGTGVVEMLEKHGRPGFEFFGFSLTPDDGSAVRKRIAGAFDQFHDVSALSDEAAAQRINELGIDVLVELVPHSEGSRPRILAQRPAPVQVNLWSAGYSGGADYYDYVLGDPWALPLSDQPFYVEKIVHLPHTCFLYDATQPVADGTPTRAEEGLPEQGFVFCCFNASYKISAEMFALWMRLLRAVEGSVLWLAHSNDLAVENLRQAAKDRGVDPSRLVFAKRKPVMAEHLARHRLADLFLDTLPYNAHTTAMDALWAGLPLVTCTGRTFVGRLATSQMHGIGLPELVVADLAGYEALALALARDPARLMQLKAKVAANRQAFPLFDMARLCRELESAYATMADISRRGDSPKSFTVKDDAART